MTQDDPKLKLGDDGEIIDASWLDNPEKPKRGVRFHSTNTAVIIATIGGLVVLCSLCLVSLGISNLGQSAAVNSAASSVMSATQVAFAITQTSFARTQVAASTPLTRLQSCSAVLALPGDKLAITYPKNNVSTVYIMDMNRQSACEPFPDSEDFVLHRSVLAPAWSPDGRYLAFEAHKGATLDVFVFNIDLLILQQITHDGWVVEGQLAWSPDSQHIAYRTQGPGDEFARYAIVDFDGSNPRIIQDIIATDRPSWSSNSQSMIVVNGVKTLSSSHGNLYVTDLSGTSTHLLNDAIKSAYAPAWSPDGLWIAFTSDRDGKSVLYLSSADGSVVRRLTDQSSSNWNPIWSPDGKQLCFLSDRFGMTQLFLMTAEGGFASRLGTSPAVVGLPVWSSDSKQIAFMAGQGQTYTLYIAGTDASQQAKSPALIMNMPPIKEIEGLQLSWMPVHAKN